MPFATIPCKDCGDTFTVPYTYAVEPTTHPAPQDANFPVDKRCVACEDKHVAAAAKRKADRAEDKHAEEVAAKKKADAATAAQADADARKASAAKAETTWRNEQPNPASPRPGTPQTQFTPRPAAPSNPTFAPPPPGFSPAQEPGVPTPKPQPRPAPPTFDRPPSETERGPFFGNR